MTPPTRPLTWKVKGTSEQARAPPFGLGEPSRHSGDRKSSSPECRHVDKNRRVKVGRTRQVCKTAWRQAFLSPPRGGGRSPSISAPYSPARRGLVCFSVRSGFHFSDPSP